MAIPLDKTQLGEDVEYTPSEPHPDHGARFRVRPVRPKYVREDSELKVFRVWGPDGVLIGEALTPEDAEKLVQRGVFDWANRGRGGGGG